MMLTELFTDFIIFSIKIALPSQNYLMTPRPASPLYRCSFRAEDCDHSHASRSRRLLPLADHWLALTWWNSGGQSSPQWEFVFRYLCVCLYHSKQDQQREPEFKQIILPLSKGSNLHKTIHHLWCFSRNFWTHSCHNFRAESWTMKGPQLCLLMATSQRSNSIKGTQITYFYSCNFW